MTVGLGVREAGTLRLVEGKSIPRENAAALFDTIALLLFIPT